MSTGLSMNKGSTFCDCVLSATYTMVVRALVAAVCCYVLSLRLAVLASLTKLTSAVGCVHFAGLDSSACCWSRQSEPRNTVRTGVLCRSYLPVET